MLIEGRCPRCQKAFSIDSMYVGTRRSCDGCAATFTLERPSKTSAARPAPAPTDRAIVFETTCRACQHVFKVDAAFAGALRSCPKCSANFVLELPPEVRAQVEARKERLYGQKPRVTLGCASCCRFGSVMADDDAKNFRCQYCGATQPMAEAQAAAEVLEAMDQRVTLGLLAGASMQHLIAQTEPAHQGMVLMVLKRVHATLGQTRSRALAEANRGAAITLRAPAVCDKCQTPAVPFSITARPLVGASPFTPYRLVWSRIEEETTELHAASLVTIFAGGVVTQKRRVTRQIEEVSYLCERCQRKPAPPELGFELVKGSPLPPL